LQIVDFRLKIENREAPVFQFFNLPSEFFNLPSAICLLKSEI